MLAAGYFPCLPAIIYIPGFVVFLQQPILFHALIGNEIRESGCGPDDEDCGSASGGETNTIVDQYEFQGRLIVLSFVIFFLFVRFKSVWSTLPSFNSL